MNVSKLPRALSRLVGLCVSFGLIRSWGGVCSTTRDSDFNPFRVGHDEGPTDVAALDEVLNWRLRIFFLDLSPVVFTVILGCLGCFLGIVACCI